MAAARVEGNRGAGLVLRPATREDAHDMARLGDLAGGGLSRHLWTRQAEPGEDPLAVGARRAARDDGPFSWRNAVIAEVGGATAGMLVTYRVGDAPEPLEDLPPMFRPLQALENRVPGTTYVNMLATYAAFRRRGVATALLAEAERQADGGGLSLIVADDNLDARRLYRGLGFVEIAEEALVPEDWVTSSRAWVLLLKA
jgi:ribosomal protein S18 acetylase RimI-like enzyme